MNLSCFLGWGKFEDNGTFTDKLMKTQLDVVNIRKCQEAYEADVSTTNQLCTEGNGTGTCWVTHSSIYLHLSLGYYIVCDMKDRDIFVVQGLK
jgi:hypothetical protein